MSNIEEELKTVDMQTFVMEVALNEEEEAEIANAIQKNKEKEAARVRKQKQLEIVKGVALGTLILGAFIAVDQLGLLN